MGYRAYQLAMGFISEELPEGVTFEDVDAEDFYSTLYYKDGVPIAAYFYSNTMEADDKAVKALQEKVGSDYVTSIDPRGLGHFALYFNKNINRP